MSNRIVTSLCVLCAILCAVQRSSAQGSLTPPGAPAPTMLTLNQVEPRTPISSVPYTISGPGSYYLTTNLIVTTGDAITITASQVTLDLNGFTVSSTAATPTGTGILLAGGNADISILNGHILGTGFANGIYPGGSNVRVVGVSVSGCSDYGIILGTASSTVVESCTVLNIGVYGIQASSVSHSSAYQCGGIAIIANTAENCYGNCSGSGEGLYTGTANDCYGYSSSGYGLYATTASGCYGFTGTGPGGLDANNASNCYGYSNGNGDGLDAVTANNCQGQSTGSGTGLYATQTAMGCYGTSGSGDGLDANNASGCSGYSIGGNGLAAAAVATGCTGVSTNYTGLHAYNANNCYGMSANYDGLSANVANNCTGLSNNSGSLSYGLIAAETAIGCLGYNTGGGNAVNATVAMGCYCFSSGSGAGLISYIANSCYSSSGDASISFHYNMP